MGKSRPRYNEKARASSRKPNQKPHPRARDGGLNIGPEQLEKEETASKTKTSTNNDM
ncbi:hypothetical protein BDC45DRAFT_436400 [Circinella umbellata]|nr:hypothetical protein BDC45DRAFT_436400 [Circinella umbellata]